MQVRGTIVRGHQVASGKGGDPRFPGGTLSMQFPHFAERGLDLRVCHPATLNVSIAPLDFQIVKADHLFREVKWHETEPAEDFSFVACRLQKEEDAGPWHSGWIYFPHPETKPEHFQPPGLIEVILESFDGRLRYDDRVLLQTGDGKIVMEGR